MCGQDIGIRKAKCVANLNSFVERITWPGVKSNKIFSNNRKMVGCELIFGLPTSNEFKIFITSIPPPQKRSGYICYPPSRFPPSFPIFHPPSSLLSFRYKDDRIYYCYCITIKMMMMVYLYIHTATGVEYLTYLDSRRSE